MIKANWPPTLEFLLNWTQTRTSNKNAMRQRFSGLLATHQSYFPKNIIKITGTNGKGSVCAMLEAAIKAEGQSVGLFTSPHLIRVTERIRINGIEISEHEMEEHAQTLRFMLEKWVEEKGIDYLPSFFEMLILIALRAFHRASVPIAIFEAGIGGANDSTSLLPGQLAAITSIGLDHVQVLGDSLNEIALNKAGIATPKSSLILGADISDDLIDVIKLRCVQNQVKPIVCEHEDLVVQAQSLQGLYFDYPDLNVHGFLNLAGSYQACNLNLALKILKQMHHFKMIAHLSSACSGLSQVCWPCRMSLLEGNPCWLLDVAHNVHGIQALIQSLDVLLPMNQRILLYGTACDKDYPAYMDDLPRLAPEVYLVEGFHRSESTHRLSELLHDKIVVSGQFQSIEQAVESLNDRLSGAGKTILVAGSVFLAGAVLCVLNSTH